RRVEQPLRRLDLARELRSERPLRIREPAAEVDDEDRRTRAERDALPEPGARVDLSRLLVGHASYAPFLPASASVFTVESDGASQRASNFRSGAAPRPM